jgi:hypothetical protein
MRYHPDRTQGENDKVRAQKEAEFKSVKEAYETLFNPEKREAYDRREGLSPSKTSHPSQDRSHFSGRTYSTEARTSKAKPIDQKTYEEAYSLARKPITEGGLGYTEHAEASDWATDVARHVEVQDFEIWIMRYEAALRYAMRPPAEGGLGNPPQIASDWASKIISEERHLARDFDAWMKQQKATYEASHVQANQKPSFSACFLGKIRSKLGI